MKLIVKFAAYFFLIKINVLYELK